MLKPTQYLPLALIVLQVGAAIVYWKAGDLRRTAYWFCAAGLTITVTF